MSISLIIFGIFLLIINISLKDSIPDIILFNLYFGFFYLMGGLVGICFSIGLLMLLSFIYVMLNPSIEVDDEKDQE
jgi:hypothetical protein